MQYLLASLIGLLGGIASGLFGIGGGIIMVPAMTLLLSPPIRDFKQAVGTSLCVIIPTAIIGSWQHARAGNIDWRTALAIAPLAITGGWLGAWLTNEIQTAHLKRAFGALLLFVGCKLLLGK
jgi:uncharacterized membrane protein YfcA